MAFDLQKEADVKEYIEKLGIEYRFGCYSEKKPEVCHLLGDYLEAIKKDFEKASKVYRSNCDDYRFGHSCLKIGNYLFLGKGKSGSKPAPAEAFKYYEKGCNLQNADSCLHSGLMLVSKSMKDEVERNVPKGVDFLQRSCDMNNATACFYLSGLHISGVHSKPELQSSTNQTPGDPKDYIIQKDMIKAFNFAYKACELKNMYACSNLSQMYARGDGTEKNEEKAEKFKKMAIEMQDELKNKQQTLGFQQGIL